VANQRGQVSPTNARLSGCATYCANHADRTLDKASSLWAKEAGAGTHDYIVFEKREDLAMPPFSALQIGFPILFVNHRLYDDVATGMNVEFNLHLTVDADFGVFAKTVLLRYPA
jgi:hypothetical protein